MPDTNKKSILYVGEDLINYGLLQESFDKEQFALTKPARNVGEAISEIESGQHWGALVWSLVFSTGPNPERYAGGMFAYKQHDSDFLWRSSGLYIVERACQKGLITIVSKVAEPDKALVEARQLGAQIADGPFENRVNELKGIFRRALS